MQSVTGTAEAKTNKQTKESNTMLTKLNKKRGGFTLVEIMIVVAIIALLAAIAVPGFLRARKRSQASRVVNDLRLIDAAVDQYAIETNKVTGSTVNTNDWIAYLKKGSSLYNTAADLFGNTYGAQTVDSLPKVPANTWNTLSDVADTSFFSPYGHF
ncbi:MAG TPA: prepilin-type N-terminal cleavage/methylation domain-containing protein [Chthoniobacterales bacterium]